LVGQASELAVPAMVTGGTEGALTAVCGRAVFAADLLRVSMGPKIEAALSRCDKVAATARSTESLDELVTAYGDAVLPLALGVTDKATVFESVKRAKKHFGRLDIMVNNAGYALIGAIEEPTDQQLRDQFETNVFGAVWVIQAALPYLRERRSGHMVQLSSVARLIAMPLGGAHHVSKWALEGLNERLAYETAGFGIKVTEVEPVGFAPGPATHPCGCSLKKIGDPRSERFET
jgi:NAD(P)-dependent dehydrogenase (short-subunit alcohol dehydrogenase family)